jgi:hypothetical protein
MTAIRPLDRSDGTAIRSPERNDGDPLAEWHRAPGIRPRSRRRNGHAPA